ncbi:MAG: hypothetical protein JRJ86_20700 [Deltaproteobacteria bacterium]|nr:hypothetical protein [Deltaproteobacteria bacterium]
MVDTPEALLVADLDRSQDIREVVDQLRRIGKEELLWNHIFSENMISAVSCPGN